MGIISVAEVSAVCNFSIWKLPAIILILKFLKLFELRESMESEGVQFGNMHYTVKGNEESRLLKWQWLDFRTKFCSCP